MSFGTTPELNLITKHANFRPGILTDPVYTGKAVAGLIGLAREGSFMDADNVLFVHTGGTPALAAYPSMV